ncbi:MAG: FAD-binding protein, partial [Clostridia bacterium]
MTAAWRHRECDVLVVGAGAAGLRAAIAAGSAGARVAVACKSLLGKAGTLLATGDVADLAREAPERIEELRSWGALFAGARVGLEVLRTLQHRAVAQENVDIHMECAILRLFVAKGRIMGALGVRRATGELVLFRCKAVVLAAGSAARAWKKNSGTADATGDAFALALRAGAELADMELAQFEPDGRYRHGPGGIRVHPETAQTCVAGLYAAG